MSIYFHNVFPFSRHFTARLLLVITLAFIIGLAAMIGASRWFVDHELRAASQDINNRRFQDATKRLAYCLRIWPESVETQFLAARAARVLGDEVGAEAHLTACRRIGGFSKEIELESALLRAQRGDLDFDLDKYLQTFVVENHPDSTLILEALGQGYAKAFRYSQATMCFQLWRQRQPNQADPYFRIATLMKLCHEEIEAESCLNKALELNSGHFAARLQLAELLIQQRRPSQALKHFEVLQRAEPDNRDVLIGLAQSLLQSGRIEEALKLVDHVLLLHPKDARALSERGHLALQLGHPEVAEGFLREAVARDRSLRLAYYDLFLCLKSLGRSEEAKAFLNRADQIKRTADRLDRLTREIIASPSDFQLRYEAGLAFQELGFEEDAIRWFKSAINEMPDHVQSLESLASSYERLGELGIASDYRQRIEKHRNHN